MTVSVVVYKLRFSNGTYLCAIASQADVSVRVRVCADLHWWHSFLRVYVFLQWFKEPNDVMPCTIKHVGTIISGLLYWVMNW